MIFQIFLVHLNSVKSVVAARRARFKNVLLRIRSSLLLIIDVVKMCNNDVIIVSYYYIFLRIIDLCTKMWAKRSDRPCLSLRFRITANNHVRF